MAPIQSIMSSFNILALPVRSRSTVDNFENSSELSDPPSLTGDDSGSGSDPESDSNSDDHPSSGEASESRTPRVRAMLPQNRKRSASRSFGKYSRSSGPGSVPVHRPSKAISPYKRRKTLVRDAPLSVLERLPNEILQRIAIDLPTDRDFVNLTLSSPSIACRITPANSEVWRYKIIARYDHPMVFKPDQFAVAYKTRQLILYNFAGFGHELDCRRYLQLEVIRDMIMETYFNPKPYRPGPKTSRNLRAFSSPTTSPWIKVLFAVPLAGFERNRRGRPDSWFDTIQVVLSHLLLSPMSVLAHTTNTSRLNYSMLKVYHFNQQPTTLYTRHVIEANQPTVPFRSELFPNLRPSLPNAPCFVYKLDVHTLLHIRNFWHRHLIDDSEPYGEHTYAAMARGLLKLGRSPQAWDRPLYHDVPIAEKWFGHYSTLSPWPTTVKELEERQSLADSWYQVDPMTLDFITTNDYAEGHWPPALGTIPCFQNTVPEPSEADYERLFQNDGQSSKARLNRSRSTRASTRVGPVYIRGIAPFLDLPNAEEDKDSNTNDATTQFPPPRPVNKAERYHPFTSLRVRGVIHHIDPSTTVNTQNEKIPLPRERSNPALPGWKRIVMVMYKPSIRYLLQVLDHAEERFGASVTDQPTMSLNAIIAALSPPILNTGVFANANLVDAPSAQSAPVNTVPIAAPQTQQATTSAPPTQSTAPAPAPPTNQTPLHIHLHNLLHNRLRAYTLFRSHLNYPLFTPQQINFLEDAFSPPHALDWTDSTIDFAYAYEGVIIPGGKIMMGRWWRMHGADGDGEFREVDAEGNAVEIQRHDVESDEEDEVGSDGYDGDDDYDGSDDDDEGTASGSGGGHEHGHGNGGVIGNGTGNAQSTYEYNSDNFQTLGHNGLERSTAGLERGPFVFWC